MTKQKRLWLGITVAVVTLGVVVVKGKPRPIVVLSKLSLLKPTSRESGERGAVTITFKQPVSEVRAILDERLNKASGWDSSGYAPAEFFWYRLDNWEEPARKLLSNIGFNGPQVDLEPNKPAGTIMTVYNGKGILEIP